MLRVSTSMTRLGIFNTKIGVEGATAIANAAPAQMRTFFGDMFEEGQTETDLSSKNLGPEGAILVAWDLRAGFVSTSMTSLDLSNNHLARGKRFNPGNAPARYDRDMAGIKAIADALSVSTSLKSLK